jgi:hypothetical protein
VPTIIGEHCEPEVQPSGGDQQIKVANEGALLPQPSPFSPEQLANLLINAQHGDIFEKGLKHLLALMRIPGILNAFVLPRR